MVRNICTTSNNVTFELKNYYFFHYLSNILVVGGYISRSFFYYNFFLLFIKEKNPFLKAVSDERRDACDVLDISLINRSDGNVLLINALSKSML